MDMHSPRKLELSRTDAKCSIPIFHAAKFDVRRLAGVSEPQLRCLVKGFGHSVDVRRSPVWRSFQFFCGNNLCLSQGYCKMPWALPSRNERARRLTNTDPCRRPAFGLLC